MWEWVGMGQGVPDDAVVDAVLTASRTLVAVAEQSLGEPRRRRR